MVVHDWATGYPATMCVSTFFAACARETAVDVFNIAATVGIAKCGAVFELILIQARAT